jgi:Leucine-rich repeat (LRR) protein
MGRNINLYVLVLAFLWGACAGPKELDLVYTYTVSNAISNSLSLNPSVKSVVIRGFGCDVLTDNISQDCEGLDSIPRSVLKLKNLKSLSIINCGVKFIPDFTSQLDKLKHLDLSDNRGLNIENLSSLCNLERLCLNNCELEEMPSNLGRLRTLKILGLEGNNFSTKEIVRIKAELPKCKIYF